MHTYIQTYINSWWENSFFVVIFNLFCENDGEFILYITYFFCKGKTTIKWYLQNNTALLFIVNSGSVLLATDEMREWMNEWMNEYLEIK